MRKLRLPGRDSTSFAGITIGSDGGIYVVADAAWSRSVVKLTADGDFGAQVTVPALRDSSGNDLALAQPQHLAVAANGILLEGGSASLWVEGMSATGAAAWSVKLADNAVDDAVYAAGAAAGPEGDWFVAFGTGWTNSSSGLGYYTRAVARLSAMGASRWNAGDYFEPLGVADESGIRQVALAVLADSVLLATATPSAPRNADDVVLSPDSSNATLVRYTLNGKYTQAFAVGAVTDMTTLGAEAAVVLSASAGGTGYTIQRFDFDSLTVPTLPAGQACSANSDCATGACCSSALTQKATCAASNMCAQNDSCTTSAQCTGSCVIASTASTGFCATVCAASSDCPMNSFCIGTSCIPACNGGTDCPFAGTQCTEATNTEAVSVTVCVGG